MSLSTYPYLKKLAISLLKYNDDAIELLVTLGLSVNQAKIYLSSLQNGLATAKVISNTSRVGREDVYRLLPLLQEKGLISKQISAPTLFEAIPFKEAITLLIRNKEEEVSGLREKADLFIENLNDQIEKSAEDNEYKILLFSKDNPSNGPIIRNIKQTKDTYYYTTRYTEFLHICNSIVFEPICREIYRAMRRGVKVRMLLDKPKTGEPEEEFFFDIEVSNKMINHKNFDYRFTNIPPETVLILFDKKSSFIWTTANHFSSVPFIWTNNDAIVNLAKTFFHTLWEKAEEPMRRKGLPADVPITRDY
jgi:sugar-specific transcriptional regulator TrmB